MLSACRTTPEAEWDIRSYLGLAADAPIGSVELEFKELPYFVVSRSKVRWDPTMGDVTEIALVRLTDRGVVVNPELGASPADAVGRLTLIPWTNIVSLSITSAPSGAKGSEPA